MQWKPFSAVVTAILAISFGTYQHFAHQRDLDTARADVVSAERETAAARRVLDRALETASFATQRADTAEAIAARLAAQAKVRTDRRAPLPQLPDTCAPALAALAQADSSTDDALAAYASEHQAAQELRGGLDTVSAASRGLEGATERLEGAATSLVKASRPSFWARLKPDIGIGAAAGIDPETRRFSKTVGVTLSWRI